MNVISWGGVVLKNIPLNLLLLSISLLAYIEAKSGEPTGGPSGRKVFFVSPNNKASVPQKLNIKFGVSGAEIKKAGDLTPGSGHHHLIIDGKLIPRGEVIPPEESSKGQIKHFGKGQTETMIELSPGKHTLTLQFGDGAHVSYGEEMSSTITVHVK